jgi:Family of unknown function (DUF5343)
MYAVQGDVQRHPEHEVTSMAVQIGARAPYASTGSITTVIEKHRQVGLQSMSLQRLQQIGITEALAPRTMHTLTTLDFYDDQGNVTPEFDALKKVPEHDFKPRLTALLREAYAPILEVLDPATATPLDVENAFRGFEPTGQIPRMVQLFMGLMIYAGVMSEDQRKAMPTTRPSGRTGSASPGKKKDAPSGAPTAGEPAAGEPVHETRREPPPPAQNSRASSFHQMDGNTFILMTPSGAEMILTVKMEVMRTSVEDRNFIFEVVDKLRDYAAKTAPASGADNAVKGDADEVEVAS